MGQPVERNRDEMEFEKVSQRAITGIEPEKNAPKMILQGLLSLNDLSHLEHFIEVGEEQEYRDALAGWLIPLGEMQNKADTIAIEVYHKLATFLVSCINRGDLAGSINGRAVVEKVYDTEQFGTWKEAASYLMALSTQLFDIKQKEQNKRTHELIIFVQQYIETHLAEDLSLTSLAEKTFLNASYLSRLYHQTTGHKLSTFIERARIKTAKGLLQNPNEKIYEIAKHVGYDTAASFTRLFKKIEGISPQEYRDSFLLKEIKSKNI